MLADSLQGAGSLTRRVYQSDPHPLGWNAGRLVRPSRSNMRKSSLRSLFGVVSSLSPSKMLLAPARKHSAWKWQQRAYIGTQSQAVLSLQLVHSESLDARFQACGAKHNSCVPHTMHGTGYYVCMRDRLSSRVGASASTIGCREYALNWPAPATAASLHTDLIGEAEFEASGR